ncbi:restriction endonuclease subunit S [Enterobacter sp.]
MAKYKAYPEYKDSGVEWLGEIPEHWKMSKVRYCFSFDKGLTITKENLQDEGIPCLNYGEIHSKYGFEFNPSIHPLKCVDKKYLNANTKSLICKGDIIFADTSEDIIGSGNFSQLVSEVITFAGYHTIISRPINRESYRYLAYTLDSQQLRSQIQTSVKGVKVFSISQAILRGLSLWLPRVNEQKNISTFLDYHTAKIDKLVEKQLQLIELLKEKRQAVISHAVTKGLNPNAPMKDSGVEWLGKLPQHWNIVAIKHLSPVKRGASPRPIENPIFFDEDGEYLWARISDVSNSEMYLKKTTQKLSKKGAELSVRLDPNQLFLSIAGSVGKPCLTTAKTCIHDGFVYFPQLKTNNIFLYFIFEAGQCYLGLGKMGTQLNLNTETVGNIKIALPGNEEIGFIISFIIQKNKEIAMLVSKLEDSIKLIKERRTALISAAVTGKIDLRDWTPPASRTEASLTAEEATV